MLVSGRNAGGEYWERLRSTGIRGARAHGLTGPDADDCAMEFVLSAIAHVNLPASDAQLALIAHYRVIDFIRRRDRIRSQEIALPRDESIFYLKSAMLCSSHRDPELAAVVAQSLREIEWAVAQLTSTQQDLFYRHFIEEDSVRVIADSYGCTTHAVLERLSIIRKRLKKLLVGRGINQTYTEGRGVVIDSFAI